MWQRDAATTRRVRMRAGPMGSRARLSPARAIQTGTSPARDPDDRGEAHRSQFALGRSEEPSAPHACVPENRRDIGRHRRRRARGAQPLGQADSAPVEQDHLEAIRHCLDKGAHRWVLQRDLNVTNEPRGDHEGLIACPERRVGDGAKAAFGETHARPLHPVGRQPFQIFRHSQVRVLSVRARLDAQLRTQDLGAARVSGLDAGAMALEGVQLHQQDVTRFTVHVERNEHFGKIQRCRKLALPAKRVDQALEQAC
jgi:hypothetical protein